VFYFRRSRQETVLHEPMPSPATESPAFHGDAAATPWVIQGRPVILPVVVRDAVVVQAVFPVRTAAVRRLLPPHASLHPLEPWRGTALCSIGAIEYRDNDLGRYNEVAVSVFVTEAPRPPRAFLGLIAAFRAQRAGVFITRLPVTTTFSRDAGCEIWGFPKTVAEIALSDEDGRRVCLLAADGRHVLTLTAPLRGSGRLPQARQLAYACRDGVVWRTPSLMEGENVGFRLGGATLVLGEHPMADELRALGLPRRALFSTSFGRMRARFDAAERVA
jgi:hypothetical protein